MKVLRDLGFPLPGQPTAMVCQPDAPCLDQPCKGGSQDLAETSKQPPTSVTFGVPFSESEFVRAAVDAGHPKSLVSALPEHIESCVEMLARAQPHAVVEVRRRWLDKWTTRAAEIAKVPDSSWDISDSYMRHVLCKKRLQLLDEIIAAGMRMSILRGTCGQVLIWWVRHLCPMCYRAKSHLHLCIPTTCARLHLVLTRPSRLPWGLPVTTRKMSSCGIRLCKKWLLDGSLGFISCVRDIAL